MNYNEHLDSCNYISKKIKTRIELNILIKKLEEKEYKFYGKTIMRGPVQYYNFFPINVLICDETKSWCLGKL